MVPHQVDYRMHHRSPRVGELAGEGDREEKEEKTYLKK